MTSPADRLVADYLERLNAELRGVPRARRKEIVADISAHIAEGRALLPAESEAEIRTLLDRVGDPAEIAAAELPRRERRSSWREPAAIVLLLLGGFVFLAGWIVGVVLLWASSAWTTRDKLIGTLVVPGGLALSVLIMGLALAAPVQSCGVLTSSPPQVVTPTRAPRPPTRVVRTTVCSDGVSHGEREVAVLGLVVLLLAPFGTTVYLARRIRRPDAVEVSPAYY